MQRLTARDQELGLQQAMARLTALLDANVLYPAGLRDFLLRLADRYLYAPLWSADIHAEWMRSLLIDRPDIDPGVLGRTRAVMDGHFPEAVVTGYETIAAGLDLPDPGDRHVLACAGGGDPGTGGRYRDGEPAGLPGRPAGTPRPRGAASRCFHRRSVRGRPRGRGLNPPVRSLLAPCRMRPERPFGRPVRPRSPAQDFAASRRRRS